MNSIQEQRTMIDYGVNTNYLQGKDTPKSVFFSIEKAFLEQFKGKQPVWGPIGYVTYKRTYARPLANGETEEFWQTIQRVVEGVFTIQKNHCLVNQLPWYDEKAQKTSQHMFKLMWEFKFTPPGRGLWMMGTDYMYKRGGAALNNCAFCSTEHLHINFSEPFCFLMDMSMLGVGVGGDTKGAGKITIQKPEIEDKLFLVEDSREGWADILRTILNAYSGEGKMPAKISYDQIRPLGTLIKSFGGVASGPGPLIEMIDSIRKLLDKRIGGKITSGDIVDIFNLVGRCVVSGGVRRTAEIMFGEHDDKEFMELKDPEKHREEIMHHRWASNNSIFARVGMDYTDVAKRTAKNGEPGFMWLENAQKFSRMAHEADFKDIRAMGGNPCLEQTLEPYELCCVSYNTRIQTKKGTPKIGDVIGKEVEVWNGEKWSTTTPFLAGENKNLYRVILSDGSYLDVTDDHKWSVRKKTERTFKQTETKELKEGMYIESFELEKPEYKNKLENAYSHGWFSGDGFIDRSNGHETPVVLVQASEYEILPVINGREWKEQHPKNYTRPFKRVSLKEQINITTATILRDSDQGLPNEFFSMSKENIKDFIGGWIDADGTLRKQVDTDNYVLFGCEKKLRDAQLLIRRIGINHSTLSKWADVGDETNYGIRNKALWTLYIPSYECENINTKLKIVERIGSRYGINNTHPEGELIDRARKQKIISIEKLKGQHNTYCFTEPEKHMGVFGNVLTYQCLVETYPGKHDTLEEWQETLKYAYLYAKSVTLVPTHNKLTNAVMLRNRRIGCSMSGIVQAFKKFGRRALLESANEGYEKIQSYDTIYSEWLCVPKSIKTTSIKPSGTVSLLAGVTPGIHYPISQYYIRNVRFQEGSKLLDKLKIAGYKVEQDKYSLNTHVVSFPVQEEFFDRSVNEVSMWEQLENAAQIQEHWADNQVSVTITFSKEEAKDIKNALELYESRLKGVSFLPKKDHGYEQAPYIPITKEEYEEMSKQVTPIIQLKEVEHDQTDKFCDSDKCML